MSEVQDALQTLIDGGLHRSKIRDICDDIVDCDYDERWAVVLAFLHEDGQNDIDPDQISEESYNDNTFCVAGKDYRVLTEDEADDAAREYIEDSLWAFNSNFLAGETGLPVVVFDALSRECESANDAVRSIVDGSCGIDEFVSEAIKADGRGHFLNSYDGNEHEVCVGGEYFYVYRVN